ncbi:MAG: Activator of (R)-2-hydroxyglutaryl-CoA dehydratase [Candidatus Heimdallarchaeota archaeon LC_3]|nr:MAG: Activator of (R)-2-hydroxyglutaryl-CoA dehydratase [Candidatus Heimdallarchaeota archaeon LC_3]
MSSIVAGVDIGSTTAKSVVLNEKKEIIGKSLATVGVKIVEDAERAFEKAVENAGLKKEDVNFIVGTGYGRYKVHFGQAIITEISCHAKGAQFLFPKTSTILDIGGQDTKAIRINEYGEILDFAMNDKCSAGTGRFLEVCADALGYEIDEIGDLSLKGTKTVKISSTCTVFAESEVISQVSRGKKGEDILKGMHHSIAQRSVSLIRRVGIYPELTFTGGVSRNKGLVASLEKVLGFKINASPLSQYMGAIGAALFGFERLAGDGPKVEVELLS